MVHLDTNFPSGSIPSISSAQIYGGLLVTQKRISVGKFFSVLSVFSSVGSTWATIYSTGLRIQNAFPALQRVTEYMNKPTDVHERQRVEERRIEHT